MTSPTIARAGTHKVEKYGPGDLPRWYKTSLQYRYPIDKPDPNNYLKKGEGASQSCILDLADCSSSCTRCFTRHATPSVHYHPQWPTD